MLGIGGRFAGAKGMVQMPDISNLTPEQAATALSSAGLRAKTQTSVTTSNSALGNKVFNQSFTAGQLVDYETDIDFSYYIYQAPAVTITYGPAEQYDSTTETGCNKTPNNQGSSNQYFFCTRVTRYFRSRLLENGVWTGGYGQYSTQTDTNWNCSIVADQCGNTQVSVTEISRSSCIGTPGTTGYQDVTYRRNYASGTPTNVTYTVQEFGCSVPVERFEVSRSVSRGQCGSAGSGGCKCGQRTVTTTIIYNIGPTETITSTECCPDSISCSNTATYWFSCGAYEANKKRWTYRTVCTDCVGNVVSDTRYSGDVACCSLAGTCTAWSAWTTTSFGRSRTRTCYYETSSGSCGTRTETETECSQTCGSWVDTSSCSGGYKSQARTCTLASCSTYTETRRIQCTSSGGGGSTWIAV